MIDWWPPMASAGLSSNQTLAIVGGGASGVLLAIQALRLGKPGDEIAIIEHSSGPLGPGAAYRTEDPLHLLNVPAEGMSAFAAEPDSFVEWLERRAPETLVHSNGYVARCHFGRYLAELLEEAGAASPAQLLRVSDKAIRIEPPSAGSPHASAGAARSGTARVHLAGGRSIEAASVVLALGPAMSLAPPQAFASLEQGTEFFGQAWSNNGALELPSKDSRVLILGTGLTFVDIALSWIAGGHRGKITALSRRGLLPQSQLIPRTPPLPPEVAPGDGLSRVARSLIRAGRAACDASLNQKVGPTGDWRAIVDGIRPITPALWASFDAKEKARFLRHLRPYWDVHRHRLPPESAGRISEAVSMGKIHVMSGRALSSKRLRRAIQVEIFNRELGTPAKLEVDAIVACMGPANDFAAYAPKPVPGLLSSGLARVDAQGLGLDTDSDGRVCDRSGLASSWLWALGPLRRGTLWESTAIPEIRVQAEKLAALLALKE